MYPIDTDSAYMALTPAAIQQSLNIVLMLRVAAQHEVNYTLDVADALDATLIGNTVALRKTASDLHALDVSLYNTAVKMDAVLFSRGYRRFN